MANKLMEFAQKAAQENNKKKKQATVSGAKAAAIAVSKNTTKNVSPKFDPGAKITHSDYANAAALGSKDAVVGWVGDTNLRNSNKNAGTTHTPISGRRHNYNPTDTNKDTLQKVHTQHQEQAKKGVEQTAKVLDKDTIKREEYKKGLGPIGEMGIDVAYGAGQLATNIGVGTLLTGGIGGASGAITGVGKAGRLVGEVIGRGGINKALQSSQVDFNEYNKAISEGASDSEARATGLSMAAVEYLTESLFGVGSAIKGTLGKGIIDVEKLLKLGTNDIIKSTGGRAVAQSMAKFGLTSGTEGAEEFISGMIQPVLERYIYSDEKLDLGEMLKSSAYQAVIGSILGSGFGAVDVATSMNQGKFLSDKDTVDAMVSEGLNSKENTKAYQLAKTVAARMQKGSAPTLFELNQMQKENTIAINQEQKEEQKAQANTNKTIERTVGKEFVNNDGDIHDKLAYYTELRGMGADVDVPAVVQEYGKIRNTVGISMKEKLDSQNIEGNESHDTDVTAISKVLIGQGTSADFVKLNPGNEVARAVFQEQTGKTLPGTNAETRDFLINLNENMRVVAANIEKDPSSLYVRDNAVAAYQRAGKMGLPMETVTERYGTVLSEQEQKNAYEVGKNTVVKTKDKAVTPKAQKNRSTEPSRSDSGFVDKSSDKATTKNIEALDKFAKLNDLTIIMQDSIKSDGGKAANGYYNNRTIVLSKNSTLPMANVLAHESFHHLKNVAPKQATELEEFVKRVMFEDDPIKFDNEMKRLAKLYGKKEDEYLFEEFMGDQVVELYADPRLIEKLATENPTLGQKLLDFIKQFIESIKSIFGDTNTGNFFESYGIKEEALDMLAATIKAAKESPAVVEETETKYSIEIPYAKQVDMVLQNKLLKTSAVYVSETPQILLDAGMSQLPMLITQKHIRDILAEKDVNDSKKHGLTTNQIKKLPELLDKPVMMADSISKNDSVIVVTSEIDVDGFPIIVSIKPNGKGTIMDVEMVDTNFVTSVYGRSNFLAFVENLYNKDALLYVNKIKSQELFNRVRIQFPQLLNNLDFDIIIKQSGSIVNNKLSDDTKRFSLQDTVETKGGLIAVHNLGEESLKEALNLGGLPMPSIAIVTPEMGHENFGPISVILGKSTIDPTNTDNRVYSGDAWTPTFPQVDTQLNQASLDNLRDKLTSVKSERFNDGHVDYDGDNFKSHYNNAGSMEKYADNNYDLKLAYLQEIGEPYDKFPKMYETKGYDTNGTISDEDIVKIAAKVPDNLINEFMTMKFFNAKQYADEHKEEIQKIAKDTIGQAELDPFRILISVKRYKNGYEPTTTEYSDVTKARNEVDDRIDIESYHAWVNGILKNVFVKKGIRNSREMFSSSGSRRSFDALHYEYTLENIVRAMREEPENGNQAFGVTAGFLKGKLAARFKSVEEIKANISKLSDDTIVEKAYEEMGDSIMEIIHGMTDRYINSHPNENSFMVTDNAASILIYAAESNRTPTAIKKVFDEYKYQISYTNELIDDVVALFNAVIDLPVRLFEAKPRRAVGLDEWQLVVLPNNTSKDLVSELQSKNIPVDFYDETKEGDRLAKVNSHEDIRWSLQDSEGNQLTPAQAEFFKDSKVRDDRGQLLKMYHGTGNEFDVFQYTEDIGYHFGTKEQAENIANQKENPKVEAYYLSMKNPLETQDAYAWYLAKPSINAVKKAGGITEEQAAEISNQNITNKLRNEYGTSSHEVIRLALLKEKLIENGYDGIRYENITGEGNGISYIAFEPNQIKSVDNQNPTQDDDIRYSLAYHAGDLGKAEGMFSMLSGDRGTGHFGTGTYFVSDMDIIKQSKNYSQRPVHTIDFSKYNLYKPATNDRAYRLHEFLKQINRFVPHLNEARVPSGESFDNYMRQRSAIMENDQTVMNRIDELYGDRYFYYRLPDDISSSQEPFISFVERLDKQLVGHEEEREYQTQELYLKFLKYVEESYEDARSWYESPIFWAVPDDIVNSYNDAKKIFEDIYNQIKDIDVYNDFATTKKMDSPSTMYMKALGYEGVDVRHLSQFDNFGYGSVIYDLKAEDKPTVDDATVRYQLQAESDTDKLRIRNKIDELKTLLAQEKLSEKGMLPDSLAMSKLVKQLRADYNSEISINKQGGLVDELTQIFVLLKTKGNNLETVYENAHELAKAIVSQGGELTNTETEKEYRALKEYMRTTPILIEDIYKGDFGKGDFNRFRKSMFGKLKLSKDGQGMDSLYKDEILPMFTGLDLNPELTHPTDILKHILEILDEMEPVFDTFDIRSDAGRQLVDEATIDILDGMFGMDPQKPLSANQRRNKYTNILESIEKSTNEYADKTAQQKAADKAKYQKMLSDLEVSEANRRIEQKKTYDRLFAELKSERDEQLKLTKLIGEAKLKKQEEIFRKRLENTKARFFERRTKGELMDSIKRNADFLAEALIHPTDTKHIPEKQRMAIAEMLSGLDFESTHTDAWENRMGSPGKRIMRLRKLASVYKNILSDMNKGEDTPYEADETISSMLDTLADSVELKDENGNVIEDAYGNPQIKRLAELDNEELNNVRVILKYFRHAISTANKTFNGNIKETISELGENVLNDLSGAKANREHNKYIAATAKFFKEQTVSAPHFFARVGGTTEKIYDELREGWDKHIDNQTEAMDYIDRSMQGMRKKDIKQWWDKDGTANTFVLANGHNLELLPSQIMSLYALNQREQARKHIYGSGIVIAPLQVKHLKKNKSEKDNNTDSFSVFKNNLLETHERISEEDVAKIISTLTEEQKNLADKLIKFINTTTSDWGNETSQKLYGYRKFTEKHYFPIKSSDQFLQSDFNTKNFVVKVKNLGMTKNTIVTANNPIVIDDFFNVITDHITKMSMYNALVPAMTDFERVYNYKRMDGAFIESSVQGVIKKMYGQKANSFIEQFLRDLNGSSRRELGNTIPEKLLVNYKKAVLGLSLRVAVQQPTSMLRAGMLIDDVYLAEGSAIKIAGKATREEMWKHIPTARYKSWGFAQTDVSRGSRDILFGIDDPWNQATMGVYGYIDDVSWTVIFGAVKAETKDKNPELEYDTPEYWEHVRKRFNSIVDISQVVDSVFHRPDIMRDQAFFKKMLTSFMPEPLQQSNLLFTQAVRADRLIANGEIKAAGKIVTTLVVGFAAYIAVLTAAQSMVDAFNRSWTGGDDDDDKNYWELFKTHYWDNLINNLNPGTWYPGIRDIFSALEGFDAKRMDTAALTAIVGDGLKLLEPGSSYSLIYRSRKVLEDIALLTGLPLKNVLKQVESAMWAVQTAIGNPNYAIYLKNKSKFKVVEKKSVFIDLYLKAEMLGDPKDAKMIYDDLKKEGITEKDITDRIKYTYGKEFRTALEDGLLISAKATIDKMIAAGVSREELVNSVRNSVGEQYKESFANGNMDELSKYDEILKKVGYTDADLANYRYGYAKGYAKLQVYKILLSEGESAAYAEAQRWLSEYPEMYESADTLMYGIEQSADSTKADWDEGKWTKSAFDKFE